ncbi:hypothetical protein [Pseudomonas oryzihabitans]|uniref:hypothetical protein n=1 Tax=Pseudomonas oryzihabitans TaxID=47885 RepID=UPI002B1D58EC|nr:hypothetical protein [Pseudomonas oryzihabitans]
MWHWIAIYIIFAAGCALASYLWKGPIFIRTESKHFPWKLNYSFKWWRAHEWWGASVVFFLAVLIVMLIWQALGGPVYFGFGRTVLSLVCFTSTVYSIKHHSLVRKFKDHSWWITLITASITVILIIIANAYGDSYILNTTRAEPSKLPMAQKAISTIILLTMWFYIATFVLSILALINYFWDAITIQPTVFTLDKSLGINTKSKNYKAGAAHRRSEYAKIISNAGSIFTIMILISIWGTISERYNSILQQALVFSSFHLHPGDCGISGYSYASWIALIGDDKAVLATPDNTGYHFKKVSCSVLSREEIQENIIKKLSKDEYW